MRDTFRRSGDVGQDMLAVDWAATPLGPPETWSNSLQSAVRIVLSSRFSMWMAWGPELTFFCNDAYRRDTLGAKYPWALGKPASTVWSEVWQDVEGRIQRVMRTGEATWDEGLLLFLERSGYAEETYHTFSYSPLADDDGGVAGMLCVVSEVTDEVVAQRRMQTLRDLGLRTPGSASVAETVRSACAALEPSARDLPFTLVYLHDEDDPDDGDARLVGSTGFTSDHPAAPPVHRAAAPVWTVPDQPVVATVELGDRFTDLPSGDWKQPPTHAAVVPINPGSAATYGFLVAGLNPFRPVDDQYRGFLALVAGQLASSITDARAFELEQRRAETLAELDQAKTDFFTNVSHEFRTPLTLLLGPAEDALADTGHPLPDTQRHRLEVIHRNAMRLLKLVNTLLDFSRLDSGRVEAAFSPVDLAAYTRELASTFESATRRLGLTLTVDCADLPEPVHVDRDLWGKLVLNLLSNAVKFTFSGGVTVSLRAEDGAAVLAVSDTGVGIPEEDQPHLFERFRRVRGARSRTHEGSGIGLALVAETAQVHGGSVDVESRPGQGSTFTVRIPFGTAHLAPEQVSTSTSGVASQVVDGFLAEAAQLLADPGEPLHGAGPGTATSRLRVLVVDDNADIRTYVSSLLAPTYAVSTAVDGRDGLEQALADPPDLVLTDVMMPRLSGFELLRALRANPATVDLPVLMLSARGGEEETLEGLESGADDYLVKPFAARELLARIRANLELDRVRRGREQLERSQALLDQAQRLARVGSWEVDLRSGAVHTSEEFRRIVGLSSSEIDRLGVAGSVEATVHPEDRERVLDSLRLPSSTDPIRYETRLLRPDGEQVVVHVHAEVVEADAQGRPRLVRGSLQDVTEQRAAEEALARATADAEAAAREHAIADALQRSLLPQQAFDLEHLEVSTYYRAGVEGTQVGGDWYDVIELGGGRTALVVGDVMGRGVQAAAVMGQLRAAVRAYARLDLPPADLLECLDGIVRDLGADQIVTCLYAVFDPADRTLRFANAGHLPPIVVLAGHGATVLAAAEDPPLGVGLYNLRQDEVVLGPGATVVLYTDGLVERRGDDLDSGIESLRDLAGGLTGPLADAPERLVGARLPEGPDDDVAVLVARVEPSGRPTGMRLAYETRSIDISEARHAVADHLRARGKGESAVEDAVLVTSELLTNATLHAVPPIELKVIADDDEVRIEVHDRATYEPRKQRPGAEDEHGRGLQIVAALADRWGARPTHRGKTVWCVLATG